jgi:hypothetical protein
MTASRFSNHRGFAMLFAIALLGLVATAITVLTKQVGYEMRRTTLAGDDAQLRQLLLAGAQNMREHASGWNDSPEPESWSVELPASLIKRDASLSIECSPGKSGEFNAEVTVGFDGRQAIQTLHLRRSAQGWIVNDAQWGT